MFKHILLITSFFFLFAANATGLSDQRIFKIQGSKKSTYLSSGVFHHDSAVNQVTLDNMRSSFTAGQGYERIVLDLNTSSIPKLYGQINQEKSKIYLDLYDTIAGPGIKNVKGKFLSSVDVFSIEKDRVSLELVFNGNYNYEVFYLENPGRVVIDVKP